MAYEPTMSHKAAKKSWYLVYGPPKVGKTTFAASYSDKFPEEIPPKKMIALDDLYWFAIDKDALLTLEHLGLTVAHADLSGANTYRDFAKARDNGIDEVLAGIEAGIVKAVVVDTVSSADLFFQHEAAKAHPGTNEYGAMWKYVNQLHMQLARAMNRLPVPVIWLGHAKKEGGGFGGDKSDQVVKQQATGLAGGGKISLQVSGKSKDFYVNQCSVVWGMKINPSGKRVICTEGDKFFEVGHRLGGLKKEEEPNMRRILTKAEKAKPIGEVV